MTTATIDLYATCDAAKLNRLERDLAKVAVDYANGDESGYPKTYFTDAAIDDPWDLITDEQEKIARTRLTLICGFVPDGFFVNWDPRGHQLKTTPEHAAQYGLDTDWGGYGILAPSAYDDPRGKAF
jgi:hypothetical protein